jgi:hypothetical protein
MYHDKYRLDQLVQDEKYSIGRMKSIRSAFILFDSIRGFALVPSSLVRVIWLTSFFPVYVSAGDFFGNVT